MRNRDIVPASRGVDGSLGSANGDDMISSVNKGLEDER
jgi:hypothetical protein